MIKARISIFDMEGRIEVIRKLFYSLGDNNKFELKEYNECHQGGFNRKLSKSEAYFIHLPFTSEQTIIDLRRKEPQCIIRLNTGMGCSFLPDELSRIIDGYYSAKPVVAENAVRDTLRKLEALRK